MTYAQYGDESVLELTEQPLPKVGPSQLRVRVTRSSVNPVDWKVMSGALDQMMDASFPAIPGWDVAGVVDEVGPDTPEFAVGDRVAAYARKIVVSGGTFAEYVTIPVEFAAMIPDGVSDDHAGALPLTGLTARRAVNALDVGPEDTVLLHAASGGVGFLAAQLAARRGATVIGTCSPESFEKLRRIGVTPVEYGEGLTERVQQIAPDGVDAVADFVGEVLETTLAVLSERGRHVSIADPAVLEHDGQWLWVRPDGTGLAELLRMLDAGEIELDIDRTMPLEDLPEAFRISRDGEASGKIVITVQD